MQKELPEPQLQGSPLHKDDKTSPELKERMREVANFIIDKIIGVK